MQAQQSLGQLSDSQLQQVMQSGSVPQFMVLAEIARRRKTRTAMTAATPPTATVAEDVVDDVAPQQFADGGGVQRFSEGERRRREAEAQNAIAMANLQNDAAFSSKPALEPWEAQLVTGLGGNTYGVPKAKPGPNWLSDLLRPGKRTPREPGKTNVPPAGPTAEEIAKEKAAAEKLQLDGIAAMNPRMNASGVKLSRPAYAEDEPAFQFQDRSGASRDKLAEDRINLAKRKNSDWAETLMRSGAAMMAAKSDNFLANAAEGLSAGVEHYSGSAKERRKDADALSERELAIQKDRDNQEYQNFNLRQQGVNRKNDRAVAENNIANQERLTNAQMQQDAARYNLQADARRAQMAYMAKAKQSATTPADYKALVTTITKSYEASMATMDEKQKLDALNEMKRLIQAIPGPAGDPMIVSDL